MAILTNCGSISESKTSVMIRRACSEWSGFSALEIAARTPNVTFFEHVQVRKIEQILWYGRVDERNSNWFLLHLARLPLLGFLFFIPCYCFGLIQFHNNRAFRTGKENDEWYKEKLKIQTWKLWTKKELWKAYDQRWYNNFIRFYRSPKSVFVTNLYLFLVLLIAFSWFLMFNYCDYPTKLEIVLLVWVLSMFIDEIRQFYAAPVRKNLSIVSKFVARFWSWWSVSVWNKIDVLYQLLFMSAFVVKNCNILSENFYGAFLNQWNSNFSYGSRFI